MFDNITVDGDGRVLIQEDPGGNAYLALTWRVEPDAPPASRAEAVLVSDAQRFLSGAPNFLTIDEESSGILDVTDLVRHARWYQKGRQYFLADMQAHYDIPGALVQGGQFYLVASPPQADGDDRGDDRDDDGRGDDRRSSVTSDVALRKSGRN
jgi:hypothetical protein